MSAAPITVIKVGGGLSLEPGALEAVGAALGRAGRDHRLLVVPGGGPFADAVRAFGAQQPLSEHAAHWMAILGMDQYAHVLAERIAGAVLVEESGAIRPALASPGVAVLAPSRWLRAADVLPHGWEVTSDSVAAFVAGALDAERLVLIKPAGTSGAPREVLVDPYFERVLPAGMSWTALEWGAIEALDGILTASPAVSSDGPDPPSFRAAHG